MDNRFLVGLVILLASLHVYFRLSRSSRAWPKLAFSQSYASDGYFSTSDEQQEVFQIYQRLQNEEFRALDSALDPDQWKESVALRFEHSSPAGTRLVWDVFGYAVLQAVGDRSRNIRTRNCWVCRPFYNCPSKQRVGTPSVAWDGGKWLCGVQTLRQKTNCVVYSFGSNGEVTFEQALLDLTDRNCDVHIFDYSLNSEKAAVVHSVAGVTFHPYGIGKEDAIVRTPFNNGESIIKEFQVKNLSSIMAELGHSWVDVLKMDVEWEEYNVLPAVIGHYSALNQSVPVTQALIEYHHKAGYPGMTQLVHTLKEMEAIGFRTFSTEYNINGEPWNFIEYSYINVNNEGQVLSEHMDHMSHALANHSKLTSLDH